MQVFSLVYLPLLWWLETQFFESKLVIEKISCFKMTNFLALDTFIIYSNPNKGINSNNTLQKRQNTNGFIKEQAQLFLSRGSNKLYSSHQEKKEGTSM